ncbi:MAG: hypothetical protein DI598_05580 [Pseudopedobacter saltans]|uniref:Phosphatidic acid phosphatase type 2/haloperoxidase domain-containing protein n=1 Tax=Pseudopedobacter saltans TaxID=151895 RepID=A0A2W5H4C1_9SPHI|nr:MAG: hypothetical protein DI598_05580 [Pseudopedobacter saltans]
MALTAIRKEDKEPFEMPVTPALPAVKSPFLKMMAKLLSFVFHPLFIPIYVFVWMYFRFPTQFAGMDQHTFNIRAFGVFWTTAFFPDFVVFILWRLKMISSIKMESSKERIIPYVATMFFYWWMWYLSRNFTDQALALKFFYFGIFLATVPGLILNNFFKISMHGMAMGGLLAAVLLTIYSYHIYLGLDVAVVTIIAGLVLTARLSLGAHNSFEVYTGFFVGVLCQLIAYWVMM